MLEISAATMRLHLVSCRKSSTALFSADRERRGLHRRHELHRIYDDRSWIHLTLRCDAHAFRGNRSGCFIRQGLPRVHRTSRPFSVPPAKFSVSTSAREWVPAIQGLVLCPSRRCGPMLPAHHADRLPMFLQVGIASNAGALVGITLLRLYRPHRSTSGRPSLPALASLRARGFAFCATVSTTPEVDFTTSPDQTRINRPFPTCDAVPRIRRAFRQEVLVIRSRRFLPLSLGPSSPRLSSPPSLSGWRRRRLRCTRRESVAHTTWDCDEESDSASCGGPSKRGIPGPFASCCAALARTVSAFEPRFFHGQGCRPPDRNR